MYRKLSSLVYCVPVLLLFSSAYTQEKNSGTPVADSSVKEILKELSEQSGAKSDSEPEIKRKAGRFRPGAFFSGKDKKNPGKELKRGFSEFVRKRCKPSPGWFKKNLPGLFFSSVFIAGILISVLYYRSHWKKRRFMTTTRLSIMNRQVQQACRYIEKNYAQPDLSVDRICDVLITGKAYLQAIFRKELGMGVEDFIDQVRINRVKILMNRDPGLALSGLAAETGYSDEKECLAKFQKISGVDLESYRKKIPA